MARKNWQASVNYMENTSATMPGTACSMALWFYPVQVVASLRSVFRINNSAANAYLILEFLSNSTVAFSQYNLVTDAQALSTTTILLNQWNHICGVTSSGSFRNVYLNGSIGTVDTTARTNPTGSGGTFTVGNAGNAPELGYLDYLATWSTMLSSSDVAQLQTKFPNAVQSGNLTNYWPLDGNSPELDLGSNTANFTLVGTPAFDNTTVGRPSLSSGSTNRLKILYDYYQSMRG